MKKRQDIFFVKITLLRPMSNTEGYSRYINYRCIESIENITTIAEDCAIHTVTLFNDSFRYKISDKDYERLIKL